MSFLRRWSKRCEFCGRNEATKGVQLSDGQWKHVCEDCWATNRVTPYLYPLYCVITHSIIAGR